MSVEAEARRARVAFRLRFEPGDRYGHLGFRLARGGK